MKTKFIDNSKHFFDSVTEFVDQLLSALGKILLYFVQRLGRYWAAGFVALFAAFELYHIVLAYSSTGWAWAFAITGAIAFEALGINVADTTVYLYHLHRRGQADQGQYTFARRMVYFYPIIVGVTILAGGTFTGFIKVVGILSPFVAIILYIVRAMHDQAQAEMERHDTAEATEQQQQQAIEAQRQADEREERRRRLEFELEQEAADRETRRQADLLKAEATAQARLERAKQPKTKHVPKVSENGHGTFGTSAEWLPRRPNDLADLRNMVTRGEMVVPEGLKAKTFGSIIGQEERTALNWLREAYRIQSEREIQ